MYLFMPVVVVAIPWPLHKARALPLLFTWLCLVAKRVINKLLPMMVSYVVIQHALCSRQLISDCLFSVTASFVASPGVLWVLWVLQGGTARRYINRIIWGYRYNIKG